MQYKIIFLIFLFSVSFPEEDNIIEWSPSRKLTWADFKGAPDPSSTNAALTNSSITADFGFNQKGLTHTIKCRFNKLLSWGRIRNEYILNHEQGHFDIAEAHARLLHKNLTDYIFNSKTVGKDIQKIYDETMKGHVSLQQQYDLLTNHSLDTTEQIKWNNKIDSMLTNLQDYSKYN